MCYNQVPQTNRNILSQPYLISQPFNLSNIDENLKWDEHINVMIPKISAKIGILRSRRRIVPIDTLTLLDSAIILPHLEYSDKVMTLFLKLLSLDCRSYRHK